MVLQIYPEGIQLSLISGYKWFMDSWLLHRIAWVLCIDNNMEEVDYTELYLSIADMGISQYGTAYPSLFNKAIGYLKLLGLIEERKEVENEEEYIKCLERAKQDKRIKDYSKYCMKRVRTRIISKIKAKQGLCTNLLTFLCTEKGFCRDMVIE